MKRKIEQSQFTSGMQCRMTGDDVEITSTSSGVEQKAKTPVEKAAGKRALSDMVSLCMPDDRFEPFVAVAETISTKQNEISCAASSEEHVAEEMMSKSLAHHPVLNKRLKLLLKKTFIDEGVGCLLRVLGTSVSAKIALGICLPLKWNQTLCCDQLLVNELCQTWFLYKSMLLKFCCDLGRHATMTFAHLNLGYPRPETIMEFSIRSDANRHYK
nr:hypothetical protein [Tanacetum cinerariifolium]